MRIDAFRLRHMVSCLDAVCGDAGPANLALSDAGLSRVEISRTGATIAPLDEPRFLTACCELLNDPAFSAHAGLLFRDGSNLTSYIAKHSRNLREATDNSARYYAMFDPAFRYELKTSGNSASLVLTCDDPDFMALHCQAEFLLFGALGRGRALTGVNFYPIAMRFAHERTRSREAFEKLAGAPVLFGAERTEMLLALSVLDLPIPTFDADLHAHLIGYGDSLLCSQPARAPKLELQVKKIVSDDLPGRLASADCVAKRLGMSKRTFARRLAEIGATFRGLVDALRYDLAQAYLRDDLSISEIAFCLGYADQAAFSVAFKRWSGQSPGAFRATLKLEGPATD